MNTQPDHLLEAKIRILEQEMIYQHQAYAKAINIVHAYQDVIRAASCEVCGSLVLTSLDGGVMVSMGIGSKRLGCWLIRRLRSDRRRV